MTRHGRWSPAAAALVTLLVAGLLAWPSPAAIAQEIGPCSGDEGVTVVVDATAVDGAVEVRCAVGSQRSGLDALAAAGFAIEPVAATPGLLCRIDGLPDPADEPCVDDPPVDFYWAYWLAPSGVWQYASEGAATRHPEPGSIEGWSFVEGTGAAPEPGIDPAELGSAPVPEPTSPPSPEGPSGFPWATALGIGVVAAFGLAGYRHSRRRGAAIEADP